MEEHSIPVGNLLLPVLLPLAQGVLLQETVCTDDEHGCCCLETYTPLDAYDGVAHMAVTTDGVCGANLLNGLDGLNLIFIASAVDGYQLTLFETELQQLCAFLGGVLQVCALGKALCAVENLTTADAGTPDTHVV